MGRFPARLWPTRSAKALTRGHRCPESPVATGETPLLIPAVPESTKLSLKALAAASAIPLRAKRAHGKPTRRLVFPSPTVRSMPSFELPHFGRGTKEKTVPKDGLFMSALCARSIARPAGRASIFVLVDFRKAKIKKGISDSAESDSGLCPENPRPFEKGRRKLYFRLALILSAHSAGIRIVTYGPGGFPFPSYFLGTRTSVPPIYGWSTFGMVTVPSAWRWFSRNAISIRGGATTVLFRV